MEKLHFVSTGQGEVVRRESVGITVNGNCFVIVVSGDGWAEWAIEIDGRIAVESDAAYGGVDCALRDGLMYAECEMILRDPEGSGDWQLGGWPEAITEWPRESRPTRRQLAST